MLSIGEFSKVTHLTVKTLRFYHEQGLLEPSFVDPGSGYRYYAESKIEDARVIAALRQLEFSIADISEILSSHNDDSSILAFLESRRSEVLGRIREDRRIVGLLDNIITHENEAKVKMKETSFSVEQKEVDPMLIASVRMTGKYADCGPVFGKISRKFGRYLCGKPMMLHHDSEFKEDHADFEVAMPIRKGTSNDEINVRELPGGACLSLMHRGAYDDLHRSYGEVLRFAKEHGQEYVLPTREIYHKGPGMIFRGNPQKYLTEIQLVLVSR